VKVNEFRELEEDQLGDRLRAARRELYELRFKHAVGQLENSSQIAKVRHDIARIMTVITERELGLSTSPPSGEVGALAPGGEARSATAVDAGFEPEASEEVASPLRGEVARSAGGESQEPKVVEASAATKSKRVRKVKTGEKS
jgi:large subunit ribosomal protein L29